MMQFVRDSDAVGAIIAGAGSRPAEELVTALRKGGYLRKYGRRGKPKLHWFRLSHDDKELLWDSSNGKIRSISLLSVSKIVQGQTTPVFKREPLPDYESVSFSLLYSEGKGSAKERTLDVVCRNTQEFETWFLGIQLVILLNQNLAQQQNLAAANGLATAALQGAASGSGSTTPLKKQSSQPISPRRSEDKVDKIQELKQIAASLQPVKAALSGSSQRSLNTPLALPAKREIGDCYIWGSWGDAEACGLDFFEGALQCSALPTMVANTHALDIIQVAVGARHAALVTRGGEVYTWGAGLGGNMGNGTGCGSHHPQQVTRLAGKGTAAVACGHSYTAAVLSDGSLYTWGSGLGGQLGLGLNVTAAVWPTRIFAGLEGVRVSQVSCGPYHAAAIGSDGRLFTWGDGLFGKLGHGDHCSAYSPRFVTTLAEHWVISISCGWWHTAAAAVARSRLTSRGTNSSASLDSYISDADSIPSAVNRTNSNSGSFLHGNILGSSSVTPTALSPTPSTGARDGTASVLASRAADMGGAIFTWGGDFKWQQSWAKDHHQGCLGVGDLNGRLVPTLVKGEDNHVQVACGLNFTVALTNNGEVYQMGSTGAQNNREKDKADWKNALVPVLVRGLLANHVAEQLACGMSHVAVVATQRTKANSSHSGTPVTRLLTWGKNSSGQLGIGAGREDHLMPQVVSAVAGRRILFLACGGSYTLAVCEHDPRARWSRDSIDHDGLTTAASGSLVSSSGPSRLHLAGLPPSGSSGASGIYVDRGLVAAGSSAASGYGLPGAQRSVGAGGLTVSASLNSLASSGQSGSRGDAAAAAAAGGGGGGGGSGGGSSGLARKSDRGRLETRHSDRGFPVHGGLGSSNSKEHHSQYALLSSKSVGMLTRSLDRSLGGLGASAGGAGNPPQQAGLESRTVSWAPSPSDTSSRSLRGVGAHSGRNLGLSLSSGPSMVAGNNGNSHSLHLQDLSLQALASVTKRSHLPLPKSFKKLAMGRSDSNNSTRHANSSSNDWAHHTQGLRGPGVSAGTPKEQWALQGRSSSRQLSYSARSEPDLATVSATSSMTSAALSMTPSPSIHSLQEGRVGDGVGGDGGVEWQRQLRYWQERAANMEQQLCRRTHELEALRREMRFSSTSQGTHSDSQQHYSCSSLRPHTSGDRRSSGGGGTAAEAGGVSSSNLAVRRGLQPLAPVSAVQSFLDDGSSSADIFGQSSTSSIPAMGPLTGSASATPVDISSGASSGAAVGAAVSVAGGFAAAAAAGSPAPDTDSCPELATARQVHDEAEQQQQPALLQSLGSYPLPLESSQLHTGPSSSSSSMQDAHEEWGSPGSEAAAEAAEASRDLFPPSPSAASTEGSLAASAATNSTHGTSSPVLHRGTSLANWIGGDAGRAALLRARATSLGSGATGTASRTSEPDMQQQAAAVSQMPPLRSTGESFVFSQVDKQQQQQQGSASLGALREAASVCSDDSPVLAGSSSSSSQAQRQKQQWPRHSHKHEPPDDKQQQQQDMFRVMSEHSKEASRVLALFQESQRHRQQLEQQQQEQQQQQQQPGVELPPLPPSANGSGRGSVHVAPGSPRSSSAAAADATGAAPAPGATSAAATADNSSSRGKASAFDVATAAPLLPLDVDAAGEGSATPAALQELHMLREHNRLLLQQLQELRLQQQSPPPLPPPVAVTLPAVVGAVVPARTSLGAAVPPAAAGLGGSLTKHRKTLSVDIGSNSAITHEVAKGVYLSLQPLPDGGYDLKRVRFAKQIFSSADAEKWWMANRDGIYAAFRIQQQQQQQGQSTPFWGHSPDAQQQLPVASGGSGSSTGRQLVSLANPPPLGPPVANAPTLAGLKELRVKRSSNGEVTPSVTSCINSPQSSTLDLDTLQLPPSMLLDAAFAVATTGAAPLQQGEAAQVADSTQQDEQQQQQQQQQQSSRAWTPGVGLAGVAAPRSSSAGAAAVDPPLTAAVGLCVRAGGVPATGSSSRSPLADGFDPQGAASVASTHTPLSNVAEAGWQPVLPRKGSLGPAATGPDTPTAAAAVAAASSGHKRSGSGLFRWLSKDKTNDGSMSGGL